jgi:hypothetical protein
MTNKLILNANKGQAVEVGKKASEGLSNLLPLTTLITPLVLGKMENKIAQPFRGLLAALNGLAFVGIQYQLVSHLASDGDE